MLYRDTIYIMDDVNYFYTLLYHCIVHKGEIKQDYLCKLISILNNHRFIDDKEITKEHLAKMLNDFLYVNHYTINDYEDFQLQIHLKEIKKDNINFTTGFYLKLIIRRIIYKIRFK